MIQKIKSRLLILSSALAAMAVLAVPAVASAAPAPGTVDIHGSLCQGSNIDLQNNAGCPTDVKEGKFQTELAHIINILSIIIGVAAVIMIIFGGFKYITSGGASEKVTSAKNTILYAIIGLIIVALAQLIVHFVLNATPSA